MKSALNRIIKKALSFFLVWPYRASFVFISALFFLNYLFRKVSYGALFSFFSVFVCTTLTYYFVRFYSKSVFKFSRKIILTNKNKSAKSASNGSENQEYMAQEVFFVARKLMFFLLWFFVPFSLSFSIAFVVRKIPTTILSDSNKLVLSLTSGLFFSLYFKSAEKIAKNKDIEKQFLKEHQILSYVGVFSILVYSIMILGTFWIMNFDFWKSFLLLLVSFFFVFLWSILKIQSQTKIKLRYIIVLVLSVYSVLIFLLLKGSLGVFETSFLIAGFAFSSIDISQRILSKNISGTLLFAHLILTLSLLSIIFL